MYSIHSAQHALLVSHQAQTLSAIDNLAFWSDGEALCFNQAIEGAEHGQGEQPSAAPSSIVLRAFGPYLNLEKLLALYASLEEHLSLGKGEFLRRDYAPYGACAQIAVTAEPKDDIQSVLEQTAMALQLELVICQDSPSLGKPGLLLMDMDSTVIEVECIDEIAKLAGCGEQVAKVTELAMQGKLAFSDSLRNRVACLTGAPETILAEVRAALPLMNGIQTLLETLKAKGWKLAIASGGFTYFADYLQQRLGLDFAVANELAIEDGHLVGKVNGSIVDAQVKADTLGRLAERYGIEPGQTVALGDGANDLLMLSKASLGVAYHAKPVVRQQAKAAIRFGGLDGVLWMLD